VTSFREVLERVRGREHVLTVYTDDGASDLVAATRSHFSSQTVTVEVEPAAAADGGHSTAGRAVLSGPDGTELASVGLAALRDLTSGFERGVDDDAACADLVANLDRATFASYDRRQMLQATREVEDRAWRAGDGRLYAGFQQLSKFRDQHRVYDRLAATDLDVHVYGQRDGPVDTPDGVAVHERDTAAFRETWFVMFDGGSPAASAMLLAVEDGAAAARGAGDGDGFEGFWTFDADLVADGLAALRAEA